MLATSHIFLRPVQPSDADLLLEWENNPENWGVSNTKEPFTKQQIVDFVNSAHDIYINKQYRFMICLNQSETPVGCIDLFDFDEENKRVGVGVLVADKKHRNQGIATQSIQLIIDYCRNKLAIVYLFCHVFKENKNSIRLFEKCGFQFIEERKLFGKPVNYYELKLV